MTPFHLSASARRKEIAEWIHEKSPNLASAYRVAIAMLCSHPDKGDERTRILLVCHSMREVMNRLPSAALQRNEVVGHSNIKQPTPSSEQVQKLPQLRIDHPDMDLTQEVENVPVPAPVARALSNLIDAAIFENQARLSDLASFLIDDGNQKSPAVKEWRALHRYFVKWSHLPDKADGQLPTDDELATKIDIFDDHVDAVRLEFFESKSLIEDLLNSSNRKVDEDWS